MQHGLVGQKNGLRGSGNRTPGPHTSCEQTYFRRNPSKIDHTFISIKFDSLRIFLPPKACYPKNTTSFRKCWVRASSNLMHLLLAVFFGKKRTKTCDKCPGPKMTKIFPQKVSPKAGKAENNMPRVDVKPEIVSSKCEKWFQLVDSSHLKNGYSSLIISPSRGENKYI